ncbi:3-hydroxy-3-methylglutaryl-coenzyme A reductase 1 [[Candida] jaroonii]|uniref:3-hydroxy-3-methylglutaryl-coenzyme A reductase 1 n=1 Tax=[Candida] jaroonii TaxID=467808 RepID=A0ACA9YE41_9ASCO|nr:3-hydroxy-3-methylglutaryl-coenzyme A reductase 1 [[Candida] jaroonii]
MLTTRSITNFSAHRPIHVIIATAILASVAYLAVVDEYIPDTLAYSSISYYHPPGTSDFSAWVEVAGDAHPDADHLTVVPLKFSRTTAGLPDIANSFHGVNDHEKFVVLDSTTTIGSLATLEAPGVTWKARTTNRLSVYLEYLKHTVKRTQNLIQLAESFDVGLITVAYVALWYTLIKVFFDMKAQAGSKFWLGFSTLVSSTFAFLFALFTATKLGVRVPLLSMTEGLPFLVAIIGFKHKVSIAAVVSKNSTSKTDVVTIISDAIASHLVSLYRDHLVVIGALGAIIAYAHNLQGLKNFSVLAVLILSYDLVMVFTFFASILALKVEINRARRTENLKRVLEEDGISSWAATTIATHADIPQDESFLGDSASIISFKLAMLGGFFGFHGYWLGSGWLYNTTEESTTNISHYLSKTLTKHIDIGPRGTVITLLSPQHYVPLGAVVQAEDFVVSILHAISSSIKDTILSKLILLALVLSIAINIYFLNASRNQAATHKLLEKEISKPKVAAAGTNGTANVSKITTPQTATNDTANTANGTARPLDQCLAIMKEGNTPSLSNDEVTDLVVAGKLPLYALEKQLANNERAVVVRRKAIASLANAPVLNTDKLPYEGYDYDRVFGACCENVIGYMPIPVGVAGPVIIDGKPYHIPMATTEGCLVASTMRGCKALNSGGGVTTVLTRDGMTRGPVVQFPTLTRAGAAKIWIDSEEGQKTIKKAFNSTSRFARLQHIQTALAGTLLFIRFRTTTGDAMGMNMISKGVEYSLNYMIEECGFDDMDVISISGNYCMDKKPGAINWIEGRGKSVVAEARIPKEVVTKVLKSDVRSLVDLNVSKNLVGSAMAGSIGGFNSQAANLVTAVFIACGQDPAQNVESSNCITLINELPDGDMSISVSMPSIEVGTIGGGTILEPQNAMLELLGVAGPHPTNPGENARQLSRIVATAVLAAELSLCSALAAGHLVKSHMQHNRKGAEAPAPAVSAPAAPKAAPAAPKAAPAPKSNGKLSENDVNRLKEGSVNCIKS